MIGQEMPRLLCGLFPDGWIVAFKKLGLNISTCRIHCTLHSVYWFELPRVFSDTLSSNGTLTFVCCIVWQNIKIYVHLLSYLDFWRSTATLNPSSWKTRTQGQGLLQIQYCGCWWSYNVNIFLFSQKNLPLDDIAKILQLKTILLCRLFIIYIFKIISMMRHIWDFNDKDWRSLGCALIMESLLSHHAINIYCQTSNIRRAIVDNKIVDHSDVVGASPVGAAPTTSSFSN